MYKEMHPEIHREAISRLEYEFKFKAPKGKHLRGGVCPECKQKELWAYADAPWVIMCGRTNNCNHQIYLRDEFPDLFEQWEKRFKPTQENPNATADAYLSQGRGFPIERLKGLYSQEYYKKDECGSVTVRFPITDGTEHGWWQRLLDPKGKLSDRKTTFKFGFDSSGHAWIPPNVNLVESEEIWITEGIFDTIAFWLSDVVSISQLSSHNYPSIVLNKIARECDERGLARPKLIFALDNDDSGHRGTFNNIERAISEGWNCGAAQPPFNRKKLDWNDLYKQDRLTLSDLDNYRYYGELLIAKKPVDKGLLIHKRTGAKSFPFDHYNRLYWFKIDATKYDDMLGILGIDEDDNEDWLIDEKNSEKAKAIAEAVKHSASVSEIANCRPTALYYQYAEETDEAWYYFQINFPKNHHPVKNTFTGGQLSSASEFKKRLLAIAPGVIYTGNSAQLDRLLRQWTENIKRVKLTKFLGYHEDMETYALGDIAVHRAKVFYLNKEDFFELPKNINLKSKSPIEIKINPKLDQYTAGWIDDFVAAYRVKGLIALTAFFSSLFVQQIRKKHKSFPFTEIVGEAGSGKSTLIYFLWKLLGRDKYEGINPTTTSDAGLKRTFRQVSNMPVLLIESDKEGESKLRQFNFDSIKTLYDGGSLGASGVKNSGNDTIDTPFMGSVIISQNTPVCGSEAIRGRIVHIGYDKSDNNKQTFLASRKLEKYDVTDLSGFTIKCLEKEQEILNTYFETYEINDQNLQQIESIQSTRIVHNHVQFMSMFAALCKHVVVVDEEIQAAVYDELLSMAIERDKMLKADSEVVRNFWDIYEQIEANHKSITESTVLNHARKAHEKIAINFAHLYKVAADLRYQLPELRQLQDELKHSQYYKFLEANASISSAIQNRTIRCWIFQPPSFYGE